MSESEIEKKNHLGPEHFISDWFLPEANSEDGFIYPNCVPVKKHPKLLEIANKLWNECKDKTKNGKIDFIVRMDDITYRGHKIGPRQKGDIFTLRRLPKVVPSLEDLKVDKAMRDILKHKHLCNGGLVIVSGETGAGKSTTCSATVKERMIEFSSYCLTVEDPPEMPLDGFHQGGVCIQTEVPDVDDGWALAMKAAMRSFPSVHGSMLYVGETRDAKAAAEVLRIASNGHLVLTTFHADGLDSAVRRFMNLAASQFPSGDEVRNTMAACFRLALHQKLNKRVDVNGILKVEMDSKFLISPNGRSPVGQKIKSGESLNNEIITQEMTMKNQGSTGVMKIWESGI